MQDLKRCNETFQHVLAEVFSRPELANARRLIVDAYSLQHPEQYMKSSKSAAAHLAAMCWSLEYARVEKLHPALKRLVEGPRAFERVNHPPPMKRGPLTVRHVLDASDLADLARRAEEWARSAWAAWHQQQDRARMWVKEALEAPVRN